MSVEGQLRTVLILVENVRCAPKAAVFLADLGSPFSTTSTRLSYPKAKVGCADKVSFRCAVREGPANVRVWSQD